MNKEIRLIGNAILILGVILLFRSQVMEITIAPDYAKIDIETSMQLPEKVINLELIANKINYTILGSLLIIVGLQLSLVQNKIISGKSKETKSVEDEKNVSNLNSGDANNPTALNDYIKKLNEQDL